MFILFGVFLILLIFGSPIGFCLLSSSIVYLIVNDIPLSLAAQKMASGPDSFTLLAVSFFIMAGNIMNHTGVTRKIFHFADVLVGSFTGGLAHANVLASVIFSGMSGSAIADTGGLGAIELEAMKKNNYDEDFSLAVTGASSIIGPIIPPSVPAVIFGVTSGVSIGRLFIGGITPGIILALAMCGLNYFICRKKNYPKRHRPDLAEIFSSFKEAFFPLLTPVIIIGGIMGGVFTPTEAAIIAVFYATILGLCYRTVNAAAMLSIFKETLQIVISVLFIISGAMIFSYILTINQVPQNLATFLLGLVDNKYAILLILNVLILIVGCFMDVTPAIIILTPVLMPIIKTIGMDPVHFGIIMILNLMIGLLTPPVGMVLYVLSGISKVPFERIAKVILPYVLVCIVSLLIFTYVPQIILFLPNLLF